MSSPISARAGSVTVKEQEMVARGKSWERTFSKIAKRATMVAVPVIVLIGLSNLPTADAGPIAYGLCVAGCETVAIAAALLTGGILAPAAATSLVACANGCFVVLAALCA